MRGDRPSREPFLKRIWENLQEVWENLQEVWENLQEVARVPQEYYLDILELG